MYMYWNALKNYVEGVITVKLKMSLSSFVVISTIGITL